jgi:retron-type reverse transcriptase
MGRKLSLLQHSLNLYMHYAFDTWMARHFPDTSFVRYADDGLVHCKSEAEARRLQEAIGARLMACGAYSGDRDRSFRLNVTVAHEMVLRD